MNAMLVREQTVPELTLPALDIRALARRAAPPVLIGVVAIAVIVFAGGPVNALGDVLRRTLAVSPAWAVIAIGFEGLSILAYISLLSLVAGCASARIGARESAQITLAGTAATRLLPTAGAGGAALMLLTLRRSGLSAHAAARTLLAFLVLLYSVFLASIVTAGALLTFGLVRAHGPAALSAAPAAAASIAIAIGLTLALRRGTARVTASERPPARIRTRLYTTANLLGEAIRDACRLLRAGDPRLFGAIGYWAFDAAVLWATLHAFGASPALPVVALGYFVGQVANTLPLPGSVSGGIAGVLIAFGVPPALALASVLAYRTVAVWLPSPAALAALPGFRATLARWTAEDSAARSCAQRS